MYLSCSEAMTIDLNVLAHKEILYEKNKLIFKYNFDIGVIISIIISICFIIYSLIFLIYNIVNPESMEIFIAYQILALILIGMLSVAIMSLVFYIIIQKSTDKVYIPSDHQLSTYINKQRISPDISTYWIILFILYILFTILHYQTYQQKQSNEICVTIILIIHLYTFAASLYIVIHYFGTFLDAKIKNKEYKELYQSGYGYEIIYSSNTKSYDVNKIISKRVVRLN